MAENIAKANQYQYAANSSLVLQADRSGLPRRDQEPTGEAETLWGKIDPKEFGSRAIRDKPKDFDKEKRRQGDHSSDMLEGTRKRRGDGTQRRGPGRSSVINVTDDWEGIKYKPSTKETRNTYEHILSFVYDFLGDQPHDLIRSAADDVLETLKSDSLKDFDKKKEIESVLGTLESDRFAQLVNLSKKITDYDTSDAMDVNDDSARDELDDTVGVAVALDDDDEDNDNMLDDEEGNTYEAYEEEEEEDEDEEAMPSAGQGADEGEEEEEVDEETGFRTVLPGEGEGKKKKRSRGQNADVSAHDIDAYWIQRQITKDYSDAHVAQEKSTKTFEILGNEALDNRDCENQLMALFEFEHFELVHLFTKNRDLIYWCTRLARVEGDERAAVETLVRQKSLDWILTSLGGARRQRRNDKDDMDIDQEDTKTSRGRGQLPATATLMPGTTVAPRQMLDLDELAFEQGSHLMSNKKVKLPEGSFKRSKKGYEEIHVPAPKKPSGDAIVKEIPVAKLPEWCHKSFSNQKLNPVQSRVFPCAFEKDENLLLCAPTGAGKTNVAMLTILHEIAKYRDPETGLIDLDSFKVIYIAPMKALVQEMVGNFGNRLAHLGIKVAELTGDRQLTKQQIAETQMIVTTPEKWDVITRKATDRSYTALVRLIIIDEIHLLHDERGPVLESIVSRTIRNMEQTQELVRLVGLSATLPNYVDVAMFLRVKPETGLFHFDASYRPCPLKLQFIGVTEKKAIKRFQTMNEVCYEKVLEQLEQKEDNQVMVFVHSRKETAKTAMSLRDMALDKDTMSRFIKQDSASREILQSEAESVKDANLKEILPYGFAIHHAGMTRSDRGLVEALFAEGHIKILCSTATLAWGVNLPAHAVIIKGTQIYSPEKGRWVELSPQDVLQMLGRAGRPQYDTYGEGIIITAHAELQYYLSLLNTQLPIESQFIKRLADNLNAEIVLGTVRNRDEAVQWLGYTYLYVRMLRNPTLYGIPVDELEDDPYLEQKRVDLIHTAATILSKCDLMKYEKKTGRFQVSELGRIASHYYITHHSMATYNQHLRPMMGPIELFRVFALSDEFKYIPVRDEEKMELAKLLERVPIPIKESSDEPTAKINVLLQAYISQLKLEGFALISDMVFVTQSAGRILRAIFEMCLKRGWAQLSEKALDLCKMVEKRVWLSMSPLRQFKKMPLELVKRLERKDFAWDRYFDLDEQHLGELIGNPKFGRLLHRFVHQFPKLEVQARVQPITRSLLKMELAITPDFQWDESVHGSAETFWILVEDMDGETILHHEYFVLKQRYAEEEHLVTFTVQLFEPLPPNYFVKIISERWLHSETKLPVSFRHLILPEKYPPHTELYDLQPTPISDLHNPEYEKVYDGWIHHFNPIQTQTFKTLYETDEDVFVGAPTGSGKTVCAELALFHLWNQQQTARAVYVTPFQELVDQRVADWSARLKGIQGGKSVVALTGETSADLKLLERGDIICCTPTQWDVISRRWKQRKNVQNVDLFIADELHLMGNEESGPTYEVVVSRMRYIESQTKKQIRIVALSTSLANARDIGEWIGATPHAIFNFSPSVRPVPLEIHIQSYNIPHFASLMMAMAKPTYLAITQHSSDKPTIVFVPSRKQCRITAWEIITYCIADDTPQRFLHCSPDEIQGMLSHVQDKGLVEMLPYGIGIYHEALSKSDKRVVEKLYESGAIQIVVASRDTCWSLPLQSHMVVVMGTQHFEGKEHRYVDYAISDVLQMIGRASRPRDDETGKCVLMCQANKKDYYKKFLFEAIPLESHFDQQMHDHFNAEIVTKTIENKQDAVDYLTWTFLYRRMAHNPNYYGLQGVTHRHLSDHLSELVETTLNDLEETKCITVEDEMDVSPLNLGMIAAYYNINYTTVDMFSVSLKNTTKLKGLLEIVSSATEFDHLPIRHHEEGVLKRIYDRLPVKLATPKFNQPRIKTNILLQAHFSRVDLPPDLHSDQAIVLGRVLPLLQACVDVISSNGWLPPALASMELSQMVVQAMWDRDSPFRQVPHLTKSAIQRLDQQGIESIFELLEMDDAKRNETLQISGREMADVARFVNRYPNVDIGFDVSKEATSGSVVQVTVQLEREWDEEEPLGPVLAPFYPHTKDEGWWIVIGDPETKTLLAIKRVTLHLKLNVRLDFVAPKAGDRTLKVFLMSDSYNGCDQELDLELHVDPGESSDEDDEEDDDAMSE